MNTICEKIIAEKYPEKLGIFHTLKWKLERGKNEVTPSDCVLTLEELELLQLLIEELVVRQESIFGPIPYIIKKAGPAALILITKEILEKI
jgi:hypothetical protein